MAIRPVYPDDHVFRDGQSFKNVRDAVRAASAASMWHVAHEMAQRYGVADMLCLKCGAADTRREGFTYFTYRDKAIRICRKCNGNNITLR